MARPTVNQQPIAPATWVVFRLPGVKRDPLAAPPSESKTAQTAAALDQIDENVPLAPPQGKSQAELLAELTQPPRREDLFDPFALEAPPKAQFSLAELLLLITAAAVGLGGARMLSAPFAAALGGLAFVFIWLTTVQSIRSRWVHVAGWTLLAAYLAAAAAALVRMWWPA